MRTTRTNRGTWVALGISILVFASIFMVGCEDTELTAPTDGIITLTLNPGVVTIDPNRGESQGSSTIAAQVFTNDGQPLEGVSVTFSTSAGSLASRDSALKTDANGRVRDTLTLGINDPEEVTVTVQSSSIIEEGTIFKEVVGVNTFPRAAILDSPQNEAIIGQPVLFDGTSSIDEDEGDVITCYQWTLASDLGTVDVRQGTAASALEFPQGFDQEQILTVTLRVSDRPSVGAICSDTAPPVPAEEFSPFSDIIQYAITCENLAPTAIGPDQIDYTIPLGQTTAAIQLDGTASTDPDGRIVNYRWTCGNGSSPIPVGPGVVTCIYRTAGEWTATLRVEDDGVDGVTIDPRTQTFACQKTDASDTRVVVTKQ